MYTLASTSYRLRFSDFPFQECRSFLPREQVAGGRWQVDLVELPGTYLVGSFYCLLAQSYPVMRRPIRTLFRLSFLHSLRMCGHGVPRE